jgi:hypothetical protein
MGLSVGRDGVERTQEGAVRVLPPRPDVALVEMGVDVGKRRQDQALAAVVEGGDVGLGRGARRGDRRHHPIGDEDVDARQLALTGEIAGKHRERHRGVAQQHRCGVGIGSAHQNLSSRAARRSRASGGGKATR